jgi:hypothetical protein
MAENKKGRRPIVLRTSKGTPLASTKQTAAQWRPWRMDGHVSKQNAFAKPGNDTSDSGEVAGC